MKLNKFKTPEQIEKDRKFRREHYYRNRHHYLAKQKLINKAENLSVGLLLTSLKSSCRICGESDTTCIDFHHLDPSKKEFSVSQSRGGRYSVEKILDETKKCICLCSNCHRKLHSGKLALPVGIEPTKSVLETKVLPLN